jgi:hypothetical protein
MTTMRVDYVAGKMPFGIRGGMWRTALTPARSQTEEARAGCNNFASSGTLGVPPT